MLQSIKKTANGLVALFKDGTSFSINNTIKIVSSSVSVADSASVNLAQLTLPKGRWLVWGFTAFTQVGADATTILQHALCVSRTTGSLDPISSSEQASFINNYASTINPRLGVSPSEYISQGATIVYLVGYRKLKAGTSPSSVTADTPVLYATQIG